MVSSRCAFAYAGFPPRVFYLQLQISSNYTMNRKGELDLYLADYILHSIKTPGLNLKVAISRLECASSCIDIAAQLIHRTPSSSSNSWSGLSP